MFASDFAPRSSDCVFMRSLGYGPHGAALQVGSSKSGRPIHNGEATYYHIGGGHENRQHIHTANHTIASKTKWLELICIKMNISYSRQGNNVLRSGVLQMWTMWP
ncbi:hypothetical protein SKAU_G00226510 [Synaphobranchus kaupii]|uniref:Uncharacterized protein n=1 Tax=Synaphobranchus kaupii TaxID=118154 RepID=A0A9Q1IRY3_SYNKA|nr:hypothetical protein SKAU_G00226510 [Synaphobranchus kaupii]